jgi:hypothetical protein
LNEGTLVLHPARGRQCWLAKSEGPLLAGAMTLAVVANAQAGWFGLTEDYPFKKSQKCKK